MEDKTLFLINKLRKHNLRMCTAESCTSGLISANITNYSGSSEVFDCGFVTYSNNSKSNILDVKEDNIIKFGAVSREVAEYMAIGALNNSDSHISVAVTGIAGPTGGSDSKPVGLVYIASKFYKSEVVCNKYIFSGDRKTIRNKSVNGAIDLLINQLEKL